MTHFPRVALGTVESGDDLLVPIWALLNVLERMGLQVQTFAARSQMVYRDAALALTGQRKRFLDSWLMPPDVCAELFYHGTRGADFGLVEGHFGDDAAPARSGGQLETLCDWLDLPRMAIVNAHTIKPCYMPCLPANTSAIFLDNVASVQQRCRLQTMLEAYFGIPVIGTMTGQRSLRAAVSNLAAGDGPSEELGNALGSALAPHFRFEQFMEIATRRPFVPVEGSLFRMRDFSGRLNVAIAHDEAFNCFLPDMLDMLEGQGANVNFFSPLRGESIPSGTDLVYLGGGQIERFLADLSANVCMKESLWSHVIGGGRVYAESAGLSYLSREVVMPRGRRWSMVGLLPSLARWNPHPAPTRAVELHTRSGSWLFPAKERVRGYLDSQWIIHPDGCLTPLISETEQSHDVVGDHQVIGSRLHLNFAANPEYIARCFQPCRKASLNAVS